MIPFGADATYHNYHHSRNVGNYSSVMTVWDTLFNTNKDYYAYLQGAEKGKKIIK